VLESDHCEDSKIDYTRKDFLNLEALQSPFTYKLQRRSWIETVLLTWNAHTNLVAFTCVKMNCLFQSNILK